VENVEVHATSLEDIFVAYMQSGNGDGREPIGAGMKAEG